MLTIKHPVSFVNMYPRKKNLSSSAKTLTSATRAQTRQRVKDVSKQSVCINLEEKQRRRRMIYHQQLNH
jgi:hypothetical protein